MARPLRVLFVEDSPDDTELLALQLRSGGYDLAFERVETAEEMQAALRDKTWDVVLSDYNMPSFTAEAALMLLRASGLDLPFIVISGTIGEEKAVAAMRSGVHDYLLKTNLARLLPAVERELREAANRRALHDSEKFNQGVLDSLSSHVAVLDEDGVIIAVNEAWRRFAAENDPTANVGFEVGTNYLEVCRQTGGPYASAAQQAYAGIQAVLQGRLPSFQLEYPSHGARGDSWFLMRTTPLLNGRRGSVIVHIDISERKLAEESHRQSEAQYRLLAESIPQLVWMNRPDGVSEYVNQRWIDYTGMTQQAIVARGWETVVHPDDLPRLRTAWVHALRTGDPYEVECRLRRTDGLFHWFLCSALPLLDEQERIVRWVGACTAIDDRKKAEQAMLAREQHLRTIIDTTPDCIKLLAADGTILEMNPAGLAMMEAPALTEVLGRSVYPFIAPEQREQYAAFNDSVCQGQKGIMTYDMIGLHGGRKTVQTVASQLQTADGAKRHLAITRDVTQAKQLEEQYRQAQKMEAFGQLAGGIAHDFNNLITIINGYSDILLNGFPPGDPRGELLKQVRNAGDRAAALTRQLLTFSRKQVVSPTVLNLNDVISDLEKMLRRIVGEDVEMRTKLQEGLGNIKADSGHVEQVIMNLTVNARDAMPQGGALAIETSNVLVQSAGPSPGSVPAGSYVVLTVSDTGHGMDAATRTRIFEPFFTTKEVGKGTGLGLATVFGIVDQSGGHIAVQSEPGRGAAFRIHFPRVEQIMPTRKSARGRAKSPQGKETILLVEDEDGVRGYTRHVLEEAGYRVVEAGDGRAAVALGEQFQGPIHLLLTDVVMPHLSGRQVGEALHARFPQIKVLYVSGYTNDAMVRHGVREEEVAFLQKPFSPSALALKVRAVLDGHDNGQPGV